MSTVQSIYNILQYRRDIDVSSDDLIHIVNMAIRTISKKLYALGSSLIVGKMEVKIFASVNTYELLTLDVAPATAWAAGDTITGVTSGETCVIKSVISTTTFYIDERSGDFTLGEVLTNGTYTADQGAAHPTTTSLMVVVDSSPDTITYTAAQFVVEGFQADMPVSMTQASNTGIYRLNTVAAGTLTFASTEALTAAASGSFIITSDASFGYLPSDFWGLVDPQGKDAPYLDGEYRHLVPLPSTDVELDYPSAGYPLYYKILGTRFYVTPPTSADYTVKALYYQKPTEVTLPTSTVPWNEMFDDLIAEFVATYFRGVTEKNANILSVLDKLVRDGVEAVVLRYDRKGPISFPQAVNWDF